MTDPMSAMWAQLRIWRGKGPPDTKLFASGLGALHSKPGWAAMKAEWEAKLRAAHQEEDPDRAAERQAALASIRASLSGGS
ncbi:unnamed protein product [Effrenium voratum]|nr:unnamed protein product [Effrenium voratum]